MILHLKLLKVIQLIHWELRIISVLIILDRIVIVRSCLLSHTAGWAVWGKKQEQVFVCAIQKPTLLNVAKIIKAIKVNKAPGLDKIRAIDVKAIWKK